MALPKEPRQKMINIMYLVLTALLAINISAEILNAFKTINESLEKTNTAVNASTTQILASLTQKLNDPATRDRASVWKPKADQVTGYAKPRLTTARATEEEAETRIPSRFIPGQMRPHMLTKRAKTEEGNPWDHTG